MGVFNGTEGADVPGGKWSRLRLRIAVILVSTTAGRELLLAGQKSGIVWALDPEKNGEIMWETRVAQGGINGGVQWGMAADGEQVYAATSDVVVIRTPTARQLDPTMGGGLTALKIADGSKAWSAAPVPCGARPNCSPAQLAAVTAIPGAVFSGSQDGHLRAYSTRDGKILWDFDTVQHYKTVNGVKGSGGAIDGPVPSSSTAWCSSTRVTCGWRRAGNVLLAFIWIRRLAIASLHDVASCCRCRDGVVVDRTANAVREERHDSRRVSRNESCPGDEGSCDG